MTDDTVPSGGDRPPRDPLPGPVVADWVRVSKTPGSWEEYGITGASDPEAAGPAYRDLAHVSPGNAPDDVLPVVSFGTVGWAGRWLRAVCVLRRTGENDAYNRPIFSRLFYLLPYEELAARGVGWHGLARAALEAPPPADGSGPVLLDLGAADPLDRAVRGLAKRDVAALATAAARLLDSPTVLTDVGGVDLEQRLHLLDYVSALLPYGARGSLSTSTWADRNAERGARLVVGAPDGVRASASLAHPDPVDPPLSPAAEAYRTLLLEIWARKRRIPLLERLHGAEPAGAWFDITAPDAADRALELLDGLFQDESVFRDILAGRAPSRERLALGLLAQAESADPVVAATLTRYSLDLESPERPLEEAVNLICESPDARDAAREHLAARLERLLAGTAPADPPTAARTGGASGGGSRNGTGTGGRKGDGRRPAPDPYGPDHELLEEARRQDPVVLDDLLAHLLEIAGVSGRTEIPPGVAAALLGRQRPFQEGTFDGTRALLLRNRADIHREILLDALVAGDRQRAKDWHRWCYAPTCVLERAGDFALLDQLLRGWPAPNGAPPSWEGGPAQAAVLLLAAACGANAADSGTVFDALWEPLARLLTAPPGTVPYPGDPERRLRQVLGLLPVSSSPQRQARGDVLGLLTGRLPMWWLRTGHAWGEENRRKYAAAFANVLREAVLDDRAAVRAVHTLLSWAVDGQVAAGAEAGPGAGTGTGEASRADRALARALACHVLDPLLPPAPDAPPPAPDTPPPLPAVRPGLGERAIEAVLELAATPSWPSDEAGRRWEADFDARVPEFARARRLRDLRRLVERVTTSGNALARSLAECLAERLLDTAQLTDEIRPWLASASAQAVEELLDGYWRLTDAARAALLRRELFRRAGDCEGTGRYLAAASERRAFEELEAQEQTEDLDRQVRQVREEARLKEAELLEEQSALRDRLEWLRGEMTELETLRAMRNES